MGGNTGETNPSGFTVRILQSQTSRLVRGGFDQVPQVWQNMNQCQTGTILTRQPHRLFQCRIGIRREISCNEDSMIDGCCVHGERPHRQGKNSRIGKVHDLCRVLDDALHYR